MAQLQTQFPQNMGYVIRSAHGSSMPDRKDWQESETAIGRCSHMAQSSGLASGDAHWFRIGISTALILKAPQYTARQCILDISAPYESIATDERLVHHTNGRAALLSLLVPIFRGSHL